MAEFRVEIPVEVINRSDTGALSKLESELNKIYSHAQKISSAAQSAFGSLSSGASQTSASMQQAATSMEQAETATEGMGTSADKAADSTEKVGQAAQSAGSEAASSFDQAGGAVDKFSQRIEKTNASIRKTFAQKLQLTLDAIDKVTPIVKSVTTSLKNMTRKAWNVAVKMVDFVTAPFRKLKSMIMSPIMMTLGVTGIGMGASSFISTFSDFATGMSNVKALSGATEEQFVRLTETAKELGATTKFTATEASEGMSYLAMAGWDTESIIEAMPGLLDLAAAGATDLGTAADIVSDVMTAMGMSADQASRAADIFAKTATSTNTTITNLGESLKYAAPIAESFGLSLSEVSTITGMMANAGIKGSMAGTAIRSSLMKMASPSKEAAKAMSTLGLSFSDSTGKMKDMKTIIGDLSKAFSGLSEQEKLSYADDLFGDRAASAWLGIISQGADEYERLFEAIDNSAGAAKDMANTQLDNLAGDVTLLKSALDGMKISVMEQLSPALREGVQWLTSQIPKLTETLTDLATKGIEKLKVIKDRIKDVFNSSDFQNAEGFADKFFIAWDKLIAEPFTKWWEGGGRDTILNAVAKLGDNLGKLYHGIISGIFAALKGEEIDFDGLNLTGIAKAGAEAAKGFIDNFKKSFDLGGLFSEMPGLLKAGLLGFGALKIGGGALGFMKTISQIKLAFTGIPAAASGAGTAIANVGANAAAGTGLLAKFGTGLGAIGKGLAAIPGWGWVAAAAIAAITAGIILYNKAQADHEQALLDTGKAAQQYEEEYVKSARNVQSAMETLDEIKKIEIQIQENKGGNQQVIQEVKEEMEGILDRTVYITALLGDGTLTEAQAKEYQTQLENVKGQIAEVEAKLKDKTLTAEEVEQYQKELEKLKGHKAELEAALASGTLTASDIEKYQGELDALHGKEVELKVKLVKEGYNEATVQSIMDQYNGIKSGQKKITLILRDKTELTADQIAAYVSQLTSLMETKTKKEIFIKGSGLTPEEIKERKDRLDEVKSKTAQLEIKMKEGKGSMSTADWNTLITDYNSLTSEAKQIEIELKGAKANVEEVSEAKKQVAEIKGEAEGILLKIAYAKGSDLSQSDLNEIASTLANIADHEWVGKVGLENTGLSKTEMQALIDKQNELYRNMVETSGGVFTQRDVEQGRITQEDFDWWVKDQARAADIKRQEFNNQVEQDRQHIPELVNRRAEAQAELDRYDSEYGANLETMRQMQEFRRDRDEILTQNGGHIEPESAGAQQMDALMDRMKAAFVNNPAMWDAGIIFDNLNANGALYNQIGEDSFDSWMQALGWSKEDVADDYDAQKAKVQEYDDALNRQYQNEVTMATQNETAGLGYESGLTTASITDLANQYGTLDSAAQEAFLNAIAGIQELNEQADYVSEEQKINVEQVVQAAQDSVKNNAAKDVIGDITASLTELNAQYSQMDLSETPTEQISADLEKVNAALDSLGLDRINDINQIGEAIQKIGELDVSEMNFDKLGEAFSSLGKSQEEIQGVIKKLEDAKAKADNLAAAYDVIVNSDTAETAKSRLAEARSAATNLAGTYTVYIDYVQRGDLPQKPGENAQGGIYDGAFLSWVAEDGPEAIIPLGADKRGRGLDLWLQAGEMLGVHEFAQGGIMEPYGKALGELPEETESGETPVITVPTGNGGGGGGNTFQISAEVNPTFEINGGDGEDILEKIKQHQEELAEMFGGAIANKMADIVANMV